MYFFLGKAFLFLAHISLTKICHGWHDSGNVFSYQDRSLSSMQHTSWQLVNLLVLSTECWGSKALVVTDFIFRALLLATAHEGRQLDLGEMLDAVERMVDNSCQSGERICYIRCQALYLLYSLYILIACVIHIIMIYITWAVI